MTKLIIAILVLLFVVIPFVNAEQVYYCTAELAVGITYDENTRTWKKQSFKPERYTIKFNDDYTEVEGVDPATSWECKDAHYDYDSDTRICFSRQANGESFQFMKKYLRFLLLNTSVNGYVRKDPRNDNLMSAGTCEKF